MTNDKEIQKTFQIGGDDQGILYLEFLGNVENVEDNIRQAELIEQHIKKIFRDNPERKFNCLVDLTPVSKNTHYPSPKARQIYARMIDSKEFKKVSIVVPNSLSRAVMNFIVKTTKKQVRTKLFKNRKEALDWINQ